MRNRKNKLKDSILRFLKEINFKVLNLNIPRWITVIWAFVGIISLFMAWIVDKEKAMVWNSFYPISGNVGYIIFILLFIIILLTFWGNYKEKMKLYSDIDLKNYVFILFTWIFMVLVGIVCASFSVWLEMFWKEIRYWQGLILSIVSAILIIIWWYLTRKEFYKNSSEIILEKLSQERNKEKEKQNISLPF